MILWQRGLNKIQVILLALCILFTSSVSSDGSNDHVNRIMFVVSQSSATYTDVVELVRKNLGEYKNSRYIFSMLEAEEFERSVQDFDPNLIVTLGAIAAEAVMKKDAAVPVLMALITDSAFSVLATEYYGSPSKAHESKVSVICLDQPFGRSIKLSKLLIPDAKTAGIMTGPATKGHAKMIANKVTAEGMLFNIVNIKLTDNPIHRLEPLIRVSDFFIPIPDHRRINIATAKWILQLSYRYKVPVIAYSKTYLDAGALAAIYSSVENVAQQTSEFIRDTNIDSGGGAHEPAYFSINFNHSVAGNLNIKLKKEQFYYHKLKEDSG